MCFRVKFYPHEPWKIKEELTRYFPFIFEFNVPLCPAWVSEFHRPDELLPRAEHHSEAGVHSAFGLAGFLLHLIVLGFFKQFSSGV